MTAPHGIGILGYGGMVGRVACDVLRRLGPVRGGQRRVDPDQDSGAGFEAVRVDLHDRASLDRFCQGCAVVLNCAGPSYRIGDVVAMAALEAGAAYVDAFGGDVLERKLLTGPAGEQGLFVLGAGVFPGVSGVLPRWLFSQGFDTGESMSGHAGGREYCSWGAGADVLLSAVAGFGTPDAIWRQGRVVRQQPDRSGPVSVPGFRDGVFVQPFINRETILLARQSGLDEARWHTVMADEVTMAALSGGCSRLIESGPEVLDAAVGELVRAASLAMAGRHSWYAMTVEVRGRRQGRAVAKRAMLKSSDSYTISGIMAAAVARHILEDRPDNGVHWAFAVLDPDSMAERLRAVPVVESLTVVDIAPDLESKSGVSLEAGVL